MFFYIKLNKFSTFYSFYIKKTDDHGNKNVRVEIHGVILLISAIEEMQETFRTFVNSLEAYLSEKSKLVYHIEIISPIQMKPGGGGFYRFTLRLYVSQSGRLSFCLSFRPSFHSVLRGFSVVLCDVD